MSRLPNIVIWSLVLIICYGCALTYKDSPPYSGAYSHRRPIMDFRISGGPMLNLNTLPDTGAYYRYEFEENQFSINNPERMLSDLYARGFEITTAWYHGPRRCGPPGEEFTTGTVYRPVFIVHLAKRDDGFQHFNFSEIHNARHYICPYGETMFSPVFKQRAIPVMRSML